MKKALYDTDRITGGNLFVNDGEEAGQHVPHVHFHMFGRSDHEPISPYKIINSLNEYSIEQLDDQEIRLRADKFGEAV